MGRATLVLATVTLLMGCGTPVTSPRAASLPDVYLAPDSTVVSDRVPSASALESMLRERGLASEIVQKVITATRTVFDPRRLRSQQPFSLERSLDGALRLFEYEIDADSFLRVRPSVESAELMAEVVPIPKTLEQASVAGVIDADTPSLFQSITGAGERAELAIAMAQIFSGEIDFNNELRRGDRYVVAFERFVRDDRPATYGAVTAAEFQNDGRVVRAIAFTPEGGKPGYYDELGRSLRRFFLKSPLKFEPRITSQFSTRRMHPVLRTPRAHRGVDYSAPTGAEVVSVAAGRVLSATYDNTNGRMVRVRHASGYVSAYLHLSAFGSGIRAGVQVAQGQTVGRVGSTGLATGPHLHYGLQKDGVYVNPVLEHRNMPPGDPVPEGDMAAFARVRDEAMAMFSGPTPTAPVELVAEQ